jgi:flavin-dependent dehydrogenase
VECDVLVVGGGPAGSTVSALLAERGWRVTLLEKDAHPRFHIGESLLPMNMPILERLGVLEQVAQIGVPKYAAEFVSDTGDGRTQGYYFERALHPIAPHAFEVRRSEFDHLLLQTSIAKGVEVHERTRVVDVELDDSGRHRVQAIDANHEHRCWAPTFLIDASGRDTLLARKLGWKVRSEIHNSAAIFGHFENVERRSGRDEGNISIYWFGHGWLWMIPLREGIMSVGAVCWPQYLKSRRTRLDEFLWDTIRQCPGVHARMGAARLIGNAHATGNYSYRSSRVSARNCLLVGDAVAFIDPVFSSGVYLAMHGASEAAATVDECLRDPAVAPGLLRAYERRVRGGLKVLSWFIHRFTSPAMKRLFLYPGNPLRVQQAVISMLAGDVFGRTRIGARLLLFKLIYYLVTVMEWPAAWRARRMRRRGLRQRFLGDTIMPSADG